MDKDKNDALQNIGDIFGGLLKSATDTAGGLAETAGQLVNQGRDSITAALDVSGDGKADIEDIIILGLRAPGVKIDRESFLRAEFAKRYPQRVIDTAVQRTPACAGIPVKEIDRISDDVIAYERNCVSGISAALGMPGGLAMAATIPADIAQYYGFMLRAAQKLLYLYGFPEIDTNEYKTGFDSETLNLLTLCLGTMYGVAGANNAIKTLANALAKGVEKQLLKKALTKGTIYPIVKNVAKWFGMNMTKKVFAGFFRKAIPVLGGVVGGSLTFLSFKPCCDKLRLSLQDTILSNPEAKINQEALNRILSGDEDYDIE